MATNPEVAYSGPTEASSAPDAAVDYSSLYNLRWVVAVAAMAHDRRNAHTPASHPARVPPYPAAQDSNGDSLSFLKRSLRRFQAPPAVVGARGSSGATPQVCGAPSISNPKHNGCSERSCGSGSEAKNRRKSSRVLAPALAASRRSFGYSAGAVVKKSSSLRWWSSNTSASR